jgi:hypothetical protein
MWRSASTLQDFDMSVNLRVIPRLLDVRIGSRLPCRALGATAVALPAVTSLAALPVAHR